MEMHQYLVVAGELWNKSVYLKILQKVQNGHAVIAGKLSGKDVCKCMNVFEAAKGNLVSFPG